MITKAIITAAGLGTRLLPVTKELPKEMLPIFVKRNKGLIIKPLLQVLFEQLYMFGIREFAIVIGRGKRSIEDHFTPDYSFLDELSRKGKPDMIDDLRAFYYKIENSTIIWINQHQPKGFGDAVLKAKNISSSEDFLVAAGDTYIISEHGSHFKKLLKMHKKHKADASLLIREVPNPEHYGVVETEEEDGYFKVLSAIEKPIKPKTNTTILPFYIFKPSIFSIIESLEPGIDGEIQLTDAINQLIIKGLNVYAHKLNEKYFRLDIGTPEFYWEAISLSYKFLKDKK
jgi:UTP--glucose-1-phosphate uridylyltransferase